MLVIQLLQHQLALRGIVGWTGVRERDIVPGGGDAPIPWSADAVALYLDAQPDDADALGALLFERASLRNQAIEDDAKN